MIRTPNHIARLSLRLPVEERALIETAARVRGWSLSDYARSTLAQASREAVSDAKTATASVPGQ